MAFVKLDTGILHSTLWFARNQREIFITALLMAEPIELSEAVRQLEIREIKETGFEVPPGWYGFVKAASVGIIRQAMIEQEEGLIALEELGMADPASRSAEFEGRRMIRINGGFLILNYMKYREKDYTAAERQRRYRAKQKVARDNITVTRNITQAEAEVESRPLKAALSGYHDCQEEISTGIPPDLHPLNYAAKVLEELNFPHTQDNLKTVAAAIEAEVRSGKSLASAFEFVLSGSKDAKDEGIEINRFFFADAKYRGENRGKNNQSRNNANVQVQRAFSNIAAVATVLRDGNRDVAGSGSAQVEHPCLGDGAGQTSRSGSAHPSILEGKIKRRT